MPLGLSSHAYSPRAINKVVEAGGELKSFAAAARVLKRLAGLTISAQHVRRLTEEVGRELATRRDREVEDYVHHRRVEPGGPIPAGVVVAVDGGRIRTRVPHPGGGPGIHEHGWKEDKVACLYTLDGSEPGTDPHPDPPRVFTDPVRVDALARDSRPTCLPLTEMSVSNTMNQRTVVRFSDTHENPALDQALFQFRAPEGVDLIDSRKQR